MAKLTFPIQLARCGCRAVAIWGVWGVWHPPENKLSENEGICRQMKGFVGIRKIIYHKTLSYIRFTVGQYWLIIKKNGTNSVNFVRNCVTFWYLENLYYVSKNFGMSEKFSDPKMVHWRKFFWRRGGEVVKNNFIRKKFFGTKGTNKWFLIIWTWQLCTMAIRSLHGLSANFTLTPPLFKPPRYGPDAMLCYAMLCYAMLCYAMLCYAMLCYAMLC
jgi:hypothetical protein